MRNVLFMAGPMTEPLGLLAALDRHADIYARNPVSLKKMMLGAKSGPDPALRRVGKKPTGSPSSALHRPDPHYLHAWFADIRKRHRESAIILCDINGPLMPFLAPPDIDIMILTRSPQEAADAVGAPAMERATEAARRATAVFRSRVSALGVPPEGIFEIDQDEYEADHKTELTRVCRWLNVEFAASVIQEMSEEAARTQAETPDRSVIGLA